ncbi:prolyl 4-hydroxylase subunit alpha-1-like [Ylistrum balloti]|uniref:prolyl 4-hydroxylase subunit alpha-1-like n=1 Tax=Ylistrum balloti TaxID=509963 RepID=UPI0029058BDA|nr:prolyl 4-hydroxylase subunit alpha-1-like [Ylistrum balloti]
MGQRAKKRGVIAGVNMNSKVQGHTSKSTEIVTEPSSKRVPLSVIVLVGLTILIAVIYPQLSELAYGRVTKSEQLETDGDSRSAKDTTSIRDDVADNLSDSKQNDPLVEEDDDHQTTNDLKRAIHLADDGDEEMPVKEEIIQSTENKRHNPSRKNSASSQNKNTKSKTKSSGDTSKSTKKGGSSSSPTKKQTKDRSNEQDLPKEVRDFKPTFQKTMSPKKIFADGRRLPPIELLPQKPNNSSVRVFLYNEFLSEAECDGLMKVHDSHIAQANKHDPFVCFDSIATLRHHLKANGVKVKVTPQDFMPGTLCMNATFSSQLKSWLHSNWSYSTAFYPGESRFSKVFEYRVKEATSLLPENGGKFQITSYPVGIGYKTHTDCTENTDDQRDRMATILVYLQDVEEGGETMFPELGIWVKPRKGRALVWNNMNEDGKCEPMSVHKAAKVDKGHKYIIQRWYYYKSFYSLGKRPPEPELPRRAELQGRVSCDEYHHGSCRWYDEWNYDHLVDYINRKATLI